jgi:small subunit ribosomal protein S1
MEVVLATSMGFCFGVQRAMSMIEKATLQAGGSAGQPAVFMLGRLVHNRHAVRRLEDLGARLVTSLDEVPAGGTVVVSTHGVGPEVRDEVRRRGLEFIDATCPFVLRIHRIVAEMAADGFTIFVFGDDGHSEVKGILAWAAGAATTVHDAAGIRTKAKKIGLVAQTTKNIAEYRSIVQETAGRRIGHISELRVGDTICDATEQRQAAAVDLARRVEAVFVVGDRDSANTRRLGDLCQAAGAPTYLVEEADQVRAEWVAGTSRVGVTAGASTPAWVVDAVVRKLTDL